MPSPVNDPIGVLARHHRIEDGYWDIVGQRHETLPEMRLALLAALGVDTAAAEAEAGELEARLNSHPAETTVVVSAAAPVVPLRVSAADAGGNVNLTVRFEDGASRQFTCTVEAGGGEGVGADGYGAFRLVLPEPLPYGYHRAELAGGGKPYSFGLIACPDKAWLPDALENGALRAGVAVSLFGVKTKSTWGCGDFTAVEGVVDWVADEIHGSYVALNPLHAIHNRQPYNTSPYLPNSTFYRNPLYLDVDRIEDMALSEAARSLRMNPSTIEEIARLNASEFVEYEEVFALKLKFLRLLFDRYYQHEHGTGSPRDRAFEAYRSGEGDLLERYATYAALDEWLHWQNPDLWIWPDWPEEYRDPDSPAVARFRAENPRLVLFHEYLQWQLDIQGERAQAYAQARGLMIGLLHDLPLATDRCGSDLWAHRRFFVQGCRVGSPPDAFAPKGQDWSFPPPNMVAMREDGFRLFAESIRKSARHGGALRIDHVMRLFRLYWIADGFDATQGTYVMAPYEDLLRILALESHRNQVLVVGEDLGTVEPFMREALDRFRILSYRLFFFERKPDGAMNAPGEYPVRALVSSTTHDLPTLAGFWAGTDIHLRHQLGLVGDEAAYHAALAQRRRDKEQMVEALRGSGFLPPSYPISAAESSELSGDVHNAITGYLASTPSLLFTLNQEDLTKEVAQQNLPSTTWQYPNWKRKMRYTVEELRTDPSCRDYAAMFRHWLMRTGRAEPATIQR